MSALQRFESASPLGDRSLHGILLGNLVTLAAALANDWSVGPLLWIYWGQSVAIGIVNVIRMLRLKEFSTAGFKSNGRPVPENATGKRATAAFFSLHYGFFHFGYFMFLASGHVGGRVAASDWPGIAVGVLAFAAAHAYSLWFNDGRDFKDRKPNLGSIMFYPYLRIIPMHVTIIVGSGAEALALPLFIGLKTFSDVVMHFVEHALFQRGAPRAERPLSRPRPRSRTRKAA